ncbi:uncharacterized protein V6R79_021233 [Siganus canaliculatus]
MASGSLRLCNPLFDHVRRDDESEDDSALDSLTFPGRWWKRVECDSSLLSVEKLDFLLLW